VPIVRSLLFNIAFWCWTIVLAVLALPLLALPPRVMAAYGRFWSRGVQALLQILVGLTYETRGLEHAAAARPAIFAVKHQSAWETLVLLLVLPDARTALKRELTQIPLFGWCCLHAGMIRIDRGGAARAMRSLIEGARRALADGLSVIIFPEGTRVQPGERRAYQPGVAALYLHLHRPVVPVALNSGLFWPRRAFVKRPGRVVLEFLPPIEPGLARQPFMAELEHRLEAATERLLAEATGRPATTNGDA
jgi:1-acyl-sn-glycerol-3-phosphate acyltransferase